MQDGTCIAVSAEEVAMSNRDLVRAYSAIWWGRNGNKVLSVLVMIVNITAAIWGRWTPGKVAEEVTPQKLEAHPSATVVCDATSSGLCFNSGSTSAVVTVATNSSGTWYPSEVYVLHKNEY